jgi:hypothetical protein
LAPALSGVWAQGCLAPLRRNAFEKGSQLSQDRGQAARRCDGGGAALDRIKARMGFCDSQAEAESWGAIGHAG